MPPSSDLRRKVALENELRRWGQSYAYSLATRVRSNLIRGGITSLEQVGKEPLATALLTHFDHVLTAFGADVSNELPDDLKPSEIEVGFMRAIWTAIAEERSATVAQIHVENSQEILHQIVVGMRELIDKDEELSSADLPSLVFHRFHMRERARMEALATNETQWAVETVKGLEVSVLLGQGDGERKLDGDATKVWRSQGDSRVRTPPKSQFDHLSADGQKVLVHEPFIVSGQLLRWPGDTALGASSGNVYGCRCSAIYDVASVEELRRLFVQTIAVDLEPPPAPTESEIVVGIPIEGGES